jgi:hypothetical protein
MNSRITILIASGLAWTSLAHSHHNSASHYDLEKISHAEGVVTEYRMMNPHARIYFDVTSDSGEVEKWMAEGDAAAVLLRRGWTGEEIQPGDYIKITGNPSRDGSPIIEWRSIILPDGSEILGGNAVPIERERAMEDLEKRRRERRASE